jgi:hypothetical protein
MRVPIWVLAVHDCEVAQVDGFKSRDLVIDLGQPSPESVAPLRGEPMTGDQLVDDAGGRGLSTSARTKHWGRRCRHARGG